ncbi:Transcription cofactor HES-6 [Liparis tanakae]|uniref:Transcription cofactor HES-6 n=1 Tax=Liparis tanakae TaxID=230148 RepID=A0A4Z2FRN2_9TELE|nr:Transcription cofactor HES-6 [Liparis tanakae]
MTASSMAHDVEKHPSAKEERKLRKPLIERKRRERINSCLDQLKDTVVGAFRLDVKPSLGLEAQQKYSTGYIQCMHEVHNMLLACHWADKTLGSRLLNHLLKSLPRSTDPADGERRPPPRASPCRRGVPHPGTPLGSDPLVRRDGPTRHEQRPALRSSHLGTLEMWRPW